MFNAARDLQTQIQRGINGIGQAAEGAGLSVGFDQNGNATTVNRGSGSLTLGRVTLQATGTVSPPPQYDRQGENPEPGSG